MQTARHSRWSLFSLLLCGLVLGLTSAADAAGKGDRAVKTQPSGLLMQGKILDVRFSDFAQGIWTRDAASCQKLSAIEDASEGSVIAIFRGLFETPDRICMVYGAEQGKRSSQRAALNCDLKSGNTALGLVTVRQRGSQVIVLEDGEQPAQTFEFCRAVPTVLDH